MPFLATNKNVKVKPLPKQLISSSAVSVLSGFMLMAVAPAAHAQFVPDVTYTTCGQLVDNPGMSDAGIDIAIDINGTCVVSSGDHIELEDGLQDDVVIQVRSGTTLTNTDTSDEDVVFFVDNSENETVIEIQDGATIQGSNGVIFLEGDDARIVNRGDILGTGAAEEGVVYLDRDTDGASNHLNIIINDVTGRIIAQQGGPAIGIELLLVDGNDDDVHVGVQDAIDQFPFTRIVNRAGGVIQANINPEIDDPVTGDLVSDDSDGINIAGNAGTTGGFDRRCIEVVDGFGAAVAPVTNCHINLELINSGTIRTLDDNSGTAGITIEDDAIFHGRIANLQGGVIAGVRNGIRIGDVAENGGTADHSGRIVNSGTINGNGVDGRGIDLEGDGVSIVNNASGTIQGGRTGIEVGDGSADVAQNNIITNAGLILGSSFSVDSADAGAAIRINSIGGTFTGDIIGSAGIQDTLSIQTSETVLTHDVLGDYDVRITTSGTLSFTGDRTITGNLYSQGVLELDLSNTHVVTGDVGLRANSTVAITDATNVRALGSQYTLIDVGGTLEQNGATLDSSAADPSFLLDFEFVDSGEDLVVEAVAGGGNVSGSAKVSGFLNDIQFADSKVESFGETVLTAFVDGSLNNTVAFSNLGGLETASGVGSALASLAPDFSGELVQNVFNTVQNGTAQIDHRLNDLDCNQFAQTKSLASDSVEACHTFAETGAWVQSNRSNASQGSLSLGGSTYFDHGSDADSVTMTYGYDQAVSDSTILGFSGSYTETEIDEDSYAVSSTELDVLQMSAYAGHRVGNANFVTKASYAYGEADTRRQSFDVIKSQVDINSLNFQGVANYTVKLGQGYYLKPEAGLHYNNVSTSAFTETGGLNLNVDEVNSNVVDGRIGMTLGARKAISGETRADVYVTGALRNDLYGTRDDIGYNFAGQSGSLAVANLNEFAVQALAGINVVSGENFSFGAAVNSEFSDDANAVGGSLQTKLRW